MIAKASTTAVADPADEAQQQQVEQELQLRQAPRAGTDANRQAWPLSQGPAAAADDVDQLIVDEQLARQLQEVFNRGDMGKTDIKRSVGPDSAVDGADAQLAAAVAAMDAEDAADEVAGAQAADAARGPSVKDGDEAVGCSAAEASGGPSFPIPASAPASRAFGGSALAAGGGLVGAAAPASRPPPSLQQASSRSGAMGAVSSRPAVGGERFRGEDWTGV